MPVICTGGHEGHGRTRLVSALTGVSIDRLDRKAGADASADAVYATLKLNGDGSAIVADAPGASSAIDSFITASYSAALFVLAVSGNEGSMPQTYEHMNIFRMLGVDRGVVAVTKWDLVSPDARDQVLDEIDGLLNYTGFKDIPVLPVSAISGEGVGELHNHIGKIYKEFSRTGIREGATRFCVERVLTVRSIGTVATGVLWSGVLRKGDKVISLPARRQGTVRTVQVLDRPVPSMSAVERIAVGLEGIPAAEIERGDVLVLESENHPPTFAVEADIELLKTAQIIGRRTDLVVHHCACSTAARLTPLANRDDMLYPGTEARVRVRLERPLVVVEGDTFVLRSEGGGETIGGGVVTDIAPRKWRRIDYEEQARHDSKKKKQMGGSRIRSGQDLMVENLNETHQALRLLEMDGYSPRTAAMLAEAINISLPKTRELLAELASKQWLVELGDGIFCHPQALERARDQILSICDEDGGIRPVKVQSLLKVSQKYARLILKHFEQGGHIERRGKFYERTES